jgi:hypothetical protein
MCENFFLHGIAMEYFDREPKKGFQDRYQYQIYEPYLYAVDNL